MSVKIRKLIFKKRPSPNWTRPIRTYIIPRELKDLNQAQSLQFEAPHRSSLYGFRREPCCQQ
ncbi:protein of unknown function [Paenibacillus alvei]|uniref:Uncharacterized protein n=1 Tax=Paenibacillus alvei TaxID=44250 RepID=A0A383R7X8_PAEAL|nr:protein of unknown function [Paenibacillus alvei]